MLDIYIDADACPVRKEVFAVAERHGLTVFVVTQGNIRVPIDPRLRLVLVRLRGWRRLVSELSAGV